MQTPPPIPKSHASSQMTGRAKWLVAGLCVLAFLGIVGICILFIFGENSMKSTTIYTEALAKARSAPAVTNVLGMPVNDGYFFEGTISESDSSGSAHFAVPISGPKSSGHLYASGTRLHGTWHLDSLTFMNVTGPRLIDLLSTNQ
jgi:hypothetical protein